MILSNTEIVECMRQGRFSIDGLAGHEPQKSPFNTSAVDLRLDDQITVPHGDGPYQLDLSKGQIAQHLAKNSQSYQISQAQPYSLRPHQLVLARTLETVDFPMTEGQVVYSARVEGKSSLARCGILVHFTAPTIHAGFSGSITLEIINLGPREFLLTRHMFVCQLIVEEVRGLPMQAPNQFKGQSTPAGL